MAFAAAQQGVERHRLTRLATYVFGLLGLAALVAVVGVAAGWFRLGLSTDLGVELGLIVIGFAGLVLVVSVVLAGLRLGRIRRARLLSGGALVSGISGAFFALDIGLARDIVVERRAIERGHVTAAARHGGRARRRSSGGSGSGCGGSRSRCSCWPGPSSCPYAAEALGMGVLTPVFGGAGAVRRDHPAAGRPAGADPDRRAGPLPAVLAVPDQAGLDRRAGRAGARSGRWPPSRRSRASGRAAGSGLATTALITAIATAAAGLLAAVRWTQAKGVDFGAPMIATQAGAFPPGLVTNLFRGFDVCLLTTAPMAFGFSPLWSLADRAASRR